MTQKEELLILRRLLIKIGNAQWTGNHAHLGKIMEAIGRYSYNQTNSNEGNDKQEERARKFYLKRLDEV